MQDALGKSLIIWRNPEHKPAVATGESRYFLVSNSKGRVFGEVYLNRYPLKIEECPDQDWKKNVPPCDSCREGDGHICSGWYDEKESVEYASWFTPLGDETIHAWAETPVFKVPSL